MKRILTSIYPIGQMSAAPLRLLSDAGLIHVANPLGQRLSESDLIEHVGDVDGIICGTEPITSRVIAAAPKLKVIARVGSGFDSVDLAAARDRGIIVTIVPDGPAESVAELTIGLMLDALRGIGRSDRALRAGKWDRPMGQLLASQTVGIAGVSTIGGLVCRKLQALGVKVLGHDLRQRDDLAIPFVSKEELLDKSDILSLHLAANPGTQNWLGADELKQMRPGAILVNIARGGIVDEIALHEALTSGHIAHAALDVFSNEPYVGPLSQLSNTTLTAHIGSMTQEARIKMEIDAARSVIDVLSGREPSNQVR